MKLSPATRGHLAMIAQTLMIGPGYTFANRVSGAFEPMVLMQMRTLCTALIFAVVFFARGGFRGNPPRGRRDWIELLILTSIGVVINQYLFLAGIKYTTPGNSSLIYALSPMLVLLIAVFIQRTERLSPLKLAGVALALTGVVFIFLQRGASLEADRTLGNAITLAAVVCWALYLVYSRKWMQRFDPLQLTALLMMMGAVLYLPFGLPQVLKVDWSQYDGRIWFSFGYLIVVNSVLGYLLVGIGLSGLRSSQVAVYINMQPIAAIGFSVLAQGEALTPAFLGGAVCTMSGIFVLNRAQAAIERKRLAEQRWAAQQAPTQET